MYLVLSNLHSSICKSISFTHRSMPINPLEVLYWLLKPDSPKQVHANMGHLNSAGHVVFMEPHQKHIVGQSDLESMQHAQLDHLREPLLAHKPGVFHFLSGPWHNKTLKGHVLVPAVGMREQNATTTSTLNCREFTTKQASRLSGHRISNYLWKA